MARARDWEAFMLEHDARNASVSCGVRELRLRRRRSRVPWVYAVYHRHAPGPRPPLALAPQESRHIEGRREIGIESREVDRPAV